MERDFADAERNCCLRTAREIGSRHSHLPGAPREGELSSNPEIGIAEKSSGAAASHASKRRVEATSAHEFSANRHHERSMDESKDPKDEPRVAAFLLPDTFGGAIGSRLATAISRQLRDEFAPPPQTPIYEGPHFVYEMNPRLFLGRRGRGSLRVAWDTNLLIDYFQHGRAMWEGASIPEAVPGSYGEELEALQLVMAIWILRDIRFYILQRTLTDAKGALAARHLEQRLAAFRSFAAALRFNEEPGDPHEAPPLVLPRSELERALASAPPGNDRALVQEAVLKGMHVFLTRDAGVLRAAPTLGALGLLLATPADLLEELTACGALHCLLHPRFAYWELPARERVTNLYEAALAPSG